MSIGSPPIPNSSALRGWVWDDEHIRSLLVSIARSFPIDPVTLLASGREVPVAARGCQSLLNEHILDLRVGGGPRGSKGSDSPILATEPVEGSGGTANFSQAVRKQDGGWRMTYVGSARPVYECVRGSSTWFPFVSVIRHLS